MYIEDSLYNTASLEKTAFGSNLILDRSYPKTFGKRTSTRYQNHDFNTRE